MIASSQGRSLPFVGAPGVRESQPDRLSANAGELSLNLQHTTNGLQVTSLLDLRLNQELLASNPAPLFTLTLRQGTRTNEARLTAADGWGEVAWRRKRGGFTLHWANPLDPWLAGIAVTAQAEADQESSAFRWKLQVANHNKDWGVSRVVFPQVALADPGTNAAVLFPRGPGEVQRDVWRRDFRYHGNYPGGWCSMQFMAAYREGDQPTGLYVALHDPWGSTKDMDAKSERAARVVRLAFDVPAPNMGVPGNGFELEGEAVWQLLRGDWFDAAIIYRHWAQREAKWWPRLGKDGRADTPRWMRDLNAWVMTGGAPSNCVPAVKQFREFLGVPAGFHWYNWHQIPFDNDYPHYFPVKEGFAAGVAELKSVGVFPMPYINGRLWDSHDRGAEDFEFTKVALPAASKKADGSPYLETYGSKETNGEPVRLAAMCPTTRLWQERVGQIVQQLLREHGTSAVYIDQVAAAAPTLCMDRTHGHPLGGGHWWNEGYWKMLEGIRHRMPRESMLTTECNGEPFVRWFDGYLTWHWQFDGQVPAFPAIYGGTVQMFGRAYRGGATKDLALRMKAAQQLVFGEQLGWLDPGLVKEQENAEFFRQMVLLRAKFSRYFSAGEMVRPPKLLGEVPKAKVDWQWSGEWWVTTDAVLAGAWRLPKEKRLLLLFVNVSDGAVSASVQPDMSGWGLSARRLRCQETMNKASELETLQGASGIELPVALAPLRARVWELSW